MSTSSRAELRAHRGLVGALALLLVLLLGAPTQASASPTAATGACRSIPDGRLQVGGGPSRATVVVDTGSGTVWSACISFSGSISGIGALDLAARVIPGLNPAYDVYAGEGRAVCKLLGVGNNPPDCLGKSVEYWGYFHNGRYSSMGAGAVTVRDGDVDGWRWGTSGASPRRAGSGTEAAAAPPPTTAPPTTRPAPPVTASAGSMSGSPTATTAPVTSGGGTAATWPTTTAAAGAASSTSTAAPAATSGTGVTSTTVRGASSRPAKATSSGSPDGEQAAAPAAGSSSPSPPTTGGDAGSGSSSGSAVAFGLILAVILGIGLFLRSRRPTPAS